MSEPICPFCGRDPFVYVDNGVGMEAVAVDCCGPGDIYFRGARPAPGEVTLSWEEFCEIGQRLLSTSSAERGMREALQNLTDAAEQTLLVRQMVRRRQFDDAPTRMGAQTDAAAWLENATKDARAALSSKGEDEQARGQGRCESTD